MAKKSCCAIDKIILVVIFYFVKFSSSLDQSLHEDIAQLASALPGCYSNARQYYTYSMAKSSPHQKRSNLLLLRAEFYRMESSLFNDPLTIYFQDFTKSSKIPFSSGFYSFSPDYKTETIRMKVYTFKKAVPGLRVTYSNYSIPEGSHAAMQLEEAFTRRKLKTHSVCDMVWKKTSVKTFTGVTRSDCLANLGRDSVRISVSMTLTGSRITLTEGWYNVDERDTLRELKIPYVLKRKSKVTKKAPPRSKSPSPVEQTSVLSSSLKAKENLSSYFRLPSLKIRNKKRIRENLRTYQELNSLKKKLYTRLNSETKNGKPTTTNSNSKKGQNRRQSRRSRSRILRKFRHVKASLVAGRRVFYKVDLSRCKMAAQVPVDRLSFGGEIKKFQIIREQQNRKRKTKIYFSTSMTSMSLTGVETIQREITLRRGGQIEVKVTKQSHDKTRLEKQYTFRCKLFSNKKRRGNVKIFTDQSSPPKEAKSLSKIARSLSQGQSLWLVADVSKCQGRFPETAIMVGGSISDYDMVNNKETLELFLPFDHINRKALPKNGKSGFAIKIFKNNDVILTWINASNENDLDSIMRSNISPAYHCELSNRLSSESNETGGESVNVFTR